MPGPGQVLPAVDASSMSKEIDFCRRAFSYVPSWPALPDAGARMLFFSCSNIFLSLQGKIPFFVSSKDLHP